MHTIIAREFEKLEQSKSIVLDLARKLSPADYHASTNDRWSAAQILTHILISEQLALRYMQKKILGVKNLTDSGIIHQWKLFGLKISQRLPIKYRAPKAIVEKTPPALTFDELQSQWTASRHELKNFLESIDHKYARRLVFKHPIAGMLDASQGIGFLREHILHHKPQIERITRRK